MGEILGTAVAWLYCGGDFSVNMFGMGSHIILPLLSLSNI